jgi:hypothetical protein
LVKSSWCTVQPSSVRQAVWFGLTSLGAASRVQRNAWRPRRWKQGSYATRATPVPPPSVRGPRVYGAYQSAVRDCREAARSRSSPLAGPAWRGGVVGPRAVRSSRTSASASAAASASVPDPSSSELSMSPVMRLLDSCCPSAGSVGGGLFRLSHQCDSVWNPEFDRPVIPLSSWPASAFTVSSGLKSTRSGDRARDRVRAAAVWALAFSTSLLASASESVSDWKLLRRSGSASSSLSH